MEKEMERFNVALDPSYFIDSRVGFCLEIRVPPKYNAQLFRMGLPVIRFMEVLDIRSRSAAALF
jgi:hypothetical protein